MLLKDAILRSLEEINVATSPEEIYNHIIKNKYYDFKLAKTPMATVAARLGDFVRNGGLRVKKIKSGSNYLYVIDTGSENSDGDKIFNWDDIKEVF
jgi:hypothetical protein